MARMKVSDLRKRIAQLEMELRACSPRYRGRAVGRDP